MSKLIGIVEMGFGILLTLPVICYCVATIMVPPIIHCVYTGVPIVWVIIFLLLSICGVILACCGLMRIQIKMSKLIGIVEMGFGILLTLFSVIGCCWEGMALPDSQILRDINVLIAWVIIFLLLSICGVILAYCGLMHIRKCKASPVKQD